MRKPYLGPLFLFLVLALVSACAQESTPESTPAGEPAATEEPSAALTASPGGDGFQYAIDLDGMVFHWNIEGANLMVRLSAPTEGWVGIGFNPSEEMKDAQFITGFVKDGEVSIFDEHGTSKRQHRKDADLGGTDDVTEVSGAEENGATYISFTIPLVTGDSLDRPIEPGGETIVLLAYGRGDRLVQQHVARSRIEVNLESGAYTVLLSSKG